MTYKIILHDVVQLTHDTRHYVFTRPDGYTFVPGQATDVALDKDGWREEKRPFTFTGDRQAGTLSFTIKSYHDHDGVTRRFADLVPGDRVLIEEPWGAIEDKGPGVFIAGGAGITPFIPILTHRAKSGTLDGSTLIFANKTPADIILRPFWQNMSGLRTKYVLSETAENGDPQKVDGAFLDSALTDFDQVFYVCGPKGLEDEVTSHLSDRGVSDDRIVREA